MEGSCIEEVGRFAVTVENMTTERKDVDYILERQFCRKVWQPSTGGRGHHYTVIWSRSRVDNSAYKEN